MAFQKPAEPDEERVSCHCQYSLSIAVRAESQTFEVDSIVIVLRYHSSIVNQNIKLLNMAIENANSSETKKSAQVKASVLHGINELKVVSYIILDRNVPL